MKEKERKPMKVSVTDMLSLLNKFRKTSHIPKSNWGKENPIRKKYIAFLSSLQIEEVRQLKCVSKHEQSVISSKLRTYTTHIKPKMFIIARRLIDNEHFVYIERKGDLE